MSVQMKITRMASFIGAIFLACLCFYYIYNVPTFERVIIFRLIEIPAAVLAIFLSLNSSEEAMQYFGLFTALLMTCFVYLYCFFWIIIKFWNCWTNK
jgi:hypothetical protein